MTGLFITFEGGESSGKSTQAARLAKRLRALNKTVVETREPGGTPFGEDVRALLMKYGNLDCLAEIYLIWAARIEHLSKVIMPAQRRGEIVICDRYIHSTLVYQGTVNEPAVPSPDITFLLDIDPEIGLERRKSSGKGNRFDRFPIEFHRSVRSMYLAMRDLTVIDASQSEDDVESQIWEHVHGLL